MIDIPNNPTNGSTITLGTTKYTYQDGKLTPFMIKQVGTELTSPELNVEKLTEYRHPVTGKPIYSKTFSVGPLPVNSTKSVDIDLSTAEDFWIDQTNSYANRPDVNISIPMNNPIFINNIGLDKSRIFIGTIRTDANVYTKAYVCVLYTKLADTSSSPVKSLYTGSLKELNLNQETHAGYRRNGKDVYQIEVDCGALPNTTHKYSTIPNYNASYRYWFSSDSYAFNSSGNIQLPLPYVGSSAINNICVWTENNSIGINTYTNLSTYDITKVVLHYTK